MPLLLMCGYPCSGKSTVAGKIRDYFVAEGKTVEIVSDDSCGLDKNTTYNSAAGSEKEARGELRSTAQKLVNDDKLVILDSLNYIKGFRYELYCISKNSKTQQCIVHVVTPPETCIKWNEEVCHYLPELIPELVMRFEAPNSNQRWDKPCFAVTPDIELDYKAVFDALYCKGVPRPNQSTQNQPLAPVDFLHQCDTVTQEVIDIVMSQQQLGCNCIKVPGTELQLQLSNNINISQLRRLKRQFITYVKAHPPSDVKFLKDSFVTYLQRTA